MRMAIVVLFGSAALFPAALGAQPRVIDQSAPTEAAPISFTYAIGGPSGQILYQVVTTGVTGQLREVRVPLACADGRLRVEIRDVDAGGMPGATVLRAREFDSRRFPGPVTDEFATLAVRPPLALAAGDRFTIALSNDGGSCGVWPGPMRDSYPGGNGWFLAAPNTGIERLGLGDGRDDLPFETVVHPR